MLDTIYIPHRTLTLPNRQVIEVPAFEIMPRHLTVREWSEISGGSSMSRTKKTVRNPKELESMLKTLEEKTFCKWQLPSESQMDVFHEWNGITGLLDGWSVLADAWHLSDTPGRPEDGSPYPSAGHTLESRLLMRWSPTRRKFVRGWVTYTNDSNWEPGLLIRLVKCESSEKTLEWFGLR